jgi:hypothetical protein
VLSAGTLGLEHLTFGSGGRIANSVSTIRTNALRKSEDGEVPTVVPSQSHDSAGAELPADLARVVAQWASRPAAIRAAILAMIDTAMPRGE